MASLKGDHDLIQLRDPGEEGTAPAPSSNPVFSSTPTRAISTKSKSRKGSSEKSSTCGSNASQSTALRKHLIGIKTATQVAKLEEEEGAINAQLQKYDAIIANLDEELTAVQSKINDPSSWQDDDEGKALKAEEAQLKKEIRTKSYERQLHRIDSEARLKVISTQMELLKQKKDVECLVVDEEEEGDVSSGDEFRVRPQSLYSPESRVRDYVEQVSQAKELEAQARRDEEYARTIDEMERAKAEVERVMAEKESIKVKGQEALLRQQELEEKLGKLERISHTGESDGLAQQQRSTWPPPPTNTDAALSALALHMGTLAQAIGKVTTPTPPDTQGRFLARQSHAKDLPFFSGNPEEWLIFKNAYDRTTRICGFSEDENLNRLQKCLKAGALKSVQSLLTNPSNVQTVMKTLEMRFGRPKYIIQAMIEKVKRAPPIKGDKLETHIELGEAVSGLVTTLRSMGCSDHLKNPSLLQELEDKLTTNLKREWSMWKRRDPAKPVDTESFAEWMVEVVEVACDMCPPPVTQPKSEVDKKGVRDPRRRGPGGQVFVVEDRPGSSQEKKQSPPNSSEKKCAFCDKGGHKIQECFGFKKTGLEGRIKFVQEKRLCFGCLNPGHSSKTCRNKKECGTDGCTFKHHPLVHDPKFNPTSKGEKPETKKPGKVHHQTKEPVEVEVSAEELEYSELHVHTYRNLGEEPEVSFKILPIRIEGPKGSVKVCAMLDPGADITLIDKGLADALGLKGRPETFKFGGVKMSTQVESSRVNFKIRPLDSDSVFYIKEARTIPELKLPQQSIRRKFLEKWEHLKGLKIQTFTSQRALILIGQDNLDLMQTRDWKEGPSGAPIANKCPLGWVIENPKGPRTTLSNFSFHGHVTSESGLEDLHQLVKHHFTTEAFGVSPSPVKARTREDIRAQSIMDATIRKVEGRWETGLLWKSDDVQLPDGRRTALNRLHSMERKMDKDPEFASQYLAKIKEYEDKGYAKKLTKEEVERGGKRVHYISHFMNRNPKKPGKLRFILDAAAKTAGISLNDTLLKGPDQLRPLPAVLFKFRQKPIAITADIQDMFHRVKVRDEDASAQRFLWRGMDRDREPDVMEMGVLIFGATCSPAFAQEVKNRNALQFLSKYPRAVEAIINRHFVDDLLDSCEDVPEAIQVQQQITKIHNEAGFVIRQWMSSSKEVLRAIPQELRATSAEKFEIDAPLDLERILGLFWQPDKDEFTFSLNFLRVTPEILSGEKVPTKSEMLALVMSIYDPLGFMSHFTIKAKILLQISWRFGIGWNDEIPNSIQDKWHLWIQELKNIGSFRIPRCYSVRLSTADNVQLHIFNDASEKAFGTIAYFRVQKEGQVEICLIGAKARVSPLKPLSIPRLELQAAVMGSRLAKFIREEHDIKIHRTVYWTDSRTVHHWIKSDGRIYQQFVSHRIGEIQELTDVLEWRWIPGKLNVADELTRDDEPCQWGLESRWIRGPEFLRLEEDEWPKLPAPKRLEDEGDALEIKRTYVGTIVSAEDGPLINISNYSRWEKAVRVFGFVRRFLNNYALNRTGRKSYKTYELGPDEVLKAEKWWCKRVQSDCFPEDIYCLVNGKNKPKDSRLHNLNVELDADGLLRLKGRLGNAFQIPEDTKKPIVLDSKHPYTKLLVDFHHRRQGHHGQEKAVNEIRQRFHVLNLRAAVRKSWNDCQSCKNVRAKPQPPPMGQLPAHRVTSFEPAFYNTGLDFFGPIWITVGRRHEKRYGALFTCLSTRAIHLELVESLSTDDCIMGIRRFIGRRNCPAHIYTDNGTNFVGAKNELKLSLSELEQVNLVREGTARGFTWHFNPPAAPHFGGSWERLVRSVKVALSAILKEQYPQEKVLRTVFVEAEHAINSHPLTHVPCDPEDGEALTPNHFLIGRTSNVPPFGAFTQEDICLRKRWRKSQRMADQVWQRWVKEYLPTLNRQDKWQGSVNKVEVGDVVIILDGNLPRGSWPKGIVTQVFPGKDGEVRVVEVRVGKTTYTRPVVKIAVLDVRRDEEPENTVVHAVMTRAAKKKIDQADKVPLAPQTAKLELPLPLATRLGLLSLHQEIQRLKKTGWHARTLKDYKQSFKKKVENAVKEKSSKRRPSD